MKNDSQLNMANGEKVREWRSGGVRSGGVDSSPHQLTLTLTLALSLALASPLAASPITSHHCRVLFYPSVLKSSTNMLAGAKWRPPGEASEKDSRAAWVKGTPFDAGAPAMEVETFTPESAYWRTSVNVQKGHTYLVGAWVKYASARILFWNYGKKADGKPSDQRLYCFAGTQSYLTPYFSDRIRQRLGGDPDEWKLMFRTLEYPEPVAGDRITVAMGLYMSTGKVTIAAPFFIDVTDVDDTSLLIDIAGAKPVRRLTIEHVGVRDVIWQKEFPSHVTDFCVKVPTVTDFRRGMDGRNEIDGHALNVHYADGTMSKVFAPLEHVFRYR